MLHPSIESNVACSIRSPPVRAAYLGLSLVCTPAKPSRLDIVFIHGLGGDREKTWSKDRNPEFFWPGRWLPTEAGFEHCRIFTFGYNANFLPGTARSAANISQFAQELLYDLRFGTAQDGSAFDLGRVPLVFVAHSMGGLLAKKACLLGQNNKIYATLVESIKAIIFLSTPHRGSDLAKVLNRVLSATLQSRRDFIADLRRNSTSLEEINENFRHIAPRLSIWSFYETLPTRIGLQKKMVLKKDSATLGYPTEISRPLLADHHGVCKYSNTEDANYVSVRNALAALIRDLTGSHDQSRELPSGDLHARRGLFLKRFDQDNDLLKQIRLHTDGTCTWIFQENEMSEWMSAPNGCHLVWFSAAPANGKSVLSSHVVTTLREREYEVQYFFFNFGDRHKRSVASLLRALAYQIATQDWTFGQRLLDLENSGMSMEKCDASRIWHEIFETILFKLVKPKPIFWVIDALDECDSPKLLLNLLRTASPSRIALRIFITSRHTDAIHIAMTKVEVSLHLTRIAKLGSEHNIKDILLFVRQEVSHMPGSERAKMQVINKIMARAEGNFLWTTLILEQIASCYSESAIEETLAELPSDMNSLYYRMEHAILNLPRQANRALSKRLISWTLGAQRPMRLNELSEALGAEFPDILDLRRTIPDVCGQFLRVDAADHVTMVHHTAREYLQRPRDSDLFIDPCANHESLCLHTLSVLADARFSFEIDALIKHHSFILYAATSWMYHLEESQSCSTKLQDALNEFFFGRSFPLWVHLLSKSDHLEILIRASKSIASFTTLVRKSVAAENHLIKRLPGLEELEKWTIDLVKIAAKFSNALLKNPRVIYGLISPFSPQTSALHYQRYCRNSGDLCIAGGADNVWTDRLARISLPDQFEAQGLACAGRSVAVFGARGRTMLWNPHDFVAGPVFEHNEPVRCIVFNLPGDKLVTYGLQTTKVWNIPSGELFCSVHNLEEAHAISLFFTNDDSRVVAGFNDRAVRFFDIDKVNREWQVQHPLLFREPAELGPGTSSPTCIAFSNDGLYAGIAYRGSRLSIWSLRTAECINRCNRDGGIGTFSAGKYSDRCYVKGRFCWNPVTNHILGVYSDGFVFKWCPFSGEHVEASAFATDVVVSSDGKLFLSSTSSGNIKVWDFGSFSVVYQLSSADLSMGLVFGPDCRRIFDLRLGAVESLIAWEPDSLVRISCTEDPVSGLANNFAPSIPGFPQFETWASSSDCITALAIWPDGRSVCVGTDNGIVEVRSTQGAESVQVAKSNTTLGVRFVALSHDSHCIAALDVIGEIYLRQIQTANYDQMVQTTQVVKLPSPKLGLQDEIIHEMIFNTKSTLLLVITSHYSCIWSLEHAALVVSQKLEDGALRKWVNHPTQDHLLLGIGCQDLRVFYWHDLRECCDPLPYFDVSQVLEDGGVLPGFSGQAESGYEDLKGANLDTANASWRVLRASVTQNQKHILVHLSLKDSFIGATRLIMFSLSELPLFKGDPGQHNTLAIRAISMPKPTIPQIKIALGILPSDRFVFIDEELWVCTCDLGVIDQQQKLTTPQTSSQRLRETTIDGVVQRHYFIPDDWAIRESLEICYMTADGTLYYPRDDKVSVIKADLHGEGFGRSANGF